MDSTDHISQHIKLSVSFGIGYYNFPANYDIVVAQAISLGGTLILEVHCRIPEKKMTFVVRPSGVLGELQKRYKSIPDNFLHRSYTSIFFLNFLFSSKKIILKKWKNIFPKISKFL